MRSMINMISHSDFQASVYVWMFAPSSSLNETIKKLMKDGIVNRDAELSAAEINMNHSLLGIISDGHKDELLKALGACRTCAIEVGIEIQEDDWSVLEGAILKCDTQE